MFRNRLSGFVKYCKKNNFQLIKILYIDIDMLIKSVEPKVSVFIDFLKKSIKDKNPDYNNFILAYDNSIIANYFGSKERYFNSEDSKNQHLFISECYEYFSFFQEDCFKYKNISFFDEQEWRFTKSVGKLIKRDNLYHYLLPEGFDFEVKNDDLVAYISTVEDSFLLEKFFNGSKLVKSPTNMQAIIGSKSNISKDELHLFLNRYGNIAKSNGKSLITLK